MFNFPSNIARVNLVMGRPNTRAGVKIVKKTLMATEFSTPITSGIDVDVPLVVLLILVNISTDIGWVVSHLSSV